MPDLKIKVVTTISQCRRLWREFTPGKSFSDLWEYRFAFYKAYRFPLHFVLLKSQGRNVGLLPLWMHPKKKKYFWLGDVADDEDNRWPEDVDLWVKDKRYLPALLQACPRPAQLCNLKVTWRNHLKGIAVLKKASPKNILSLRSLRTVEDYLAIQSRKLRSNLRRIKRSIDLRHPQIIFNRFKDFNRLTYLNRKRFKDSCFHDTRVLHAFRALIRPGKRRKLYEVRTISVQIKGKVVGVDLIFIFKNTYYPLFCGNDLHHCSGIGMYMNLLDIQDALALGMKKMDYGESDPNASYYHYKHRLFSEISQYKLNLSK